MTAPANEFELTPQAVVRRFYDALNARDFGHAAGAVAERCEYESIATGKTFVGYEPLLTGLREFAAAFSDWRVEIVNLIEQDRFVVVEWQARGTNDGPFRGGAPTGKEFFRRGCAVAEVVGGKIVRYRDYFDRATLLEQLGLDALD